MKNSNGQRARDNSTQIQIETINQFQGIDEDRVRAIVSEQCDLVIKNCVCESQRIAEQRVSEFKTELLGVFVRRPSLVTSLQEPACVHALGKAIEAASRSESKDEKILLSELLASRFENPNNKHIATSISKAIEVIDFITNEELQALTMLYFVSYFKPVSGIIEEGLSALNEFYGQLEIQLLPLGSNWIDNLEINNVLRVSQIGSLRSFTDRQYEILKGYTNGGIEAGSSDEAEATKLLKSVGIPSGLLIDHELNPGHKRLRIVHNDQISDGTICLSNADEEKQPLTKEQIDTILQVSKMCENRGDNGLIKENLGKKIKSYKNLSCVSEWWDQIPTAISLTVVGRTIAEAIAKRIDPTIPCSTEDD